MEKLRGEQMIEKIKQKGEEATQTYALLDKDLNVAWMNKALVQKGFSPEQVQGKPYYQVFSGKGKLDEHCSTVFAAREQRITQRHERGGDGRHYHVSSIPLFKGKELSHVLEIGREKKHIESSVEQLHDLKLAADHTNASVFIVDSNRRIVHVNDPYKELHRCSEQDVLGNVHALFRKKGEGMHSPFWRNMKKGHTWHHCLVGQRKDKSRFKSEVKVTPMRDAIGKTSYYVGMEISLE